MSKWTRIRDTIKTKAWDEFDRIKDAEVHRLKQKTTYAGATGLVASIAALPQIDVSNHWVALLTSAFSIFLIYTQKNPSSIDSPCRLSPFAAGVIPRGSPNNDLFHGLRSL